MRILRPIVEAATDRRCHGVAGLVAEEHDENQLLPGVIGTPIIVHALLEASTDPPRPKRERQMRTMLEGKLAE